MKSPAFQFYPKDWLSDPNVAAMTATERGAYIQLLASMWLTEDCQLKDDPEYLSRIAQVDKVVITSLYPCFKVVNGTLRHKRLDEERLKQEKYRLSCSKAGKKGMQTRWHQGLNKVVITNDNIASSSSSSIAKKKAPPLSDEEFTKSLSESLAYKHVDVPRELAKMDVWIAANPRRKKSRQFVLNWLNRIEAPLGALARPAFQPQSTEAIREQLKQEAIKKHNERQEAQL